MAEMYNNSDSTYFLLQQPREGPLYCLREEASPLLISFLVLSSPPFLTTLQPFSHTTGPILLNQLTHLTLYSVPPHLGPLVTSVRLFVSFTHELKCFHGTSVLIPSTYFTTTA